MMTQVPRDDPTEEAAMVRAQGVGVGAALAVFAFAVVASSRPAGAADATIRVTVGGVAKVVEVRSAEGSGGPAGPADILHVESFWVPRGSAETGLAFRSKPGRLWLQGVDGKERLVGAVAAGGPAGEVAQDGLRDGDVTRLNVKMEQDTFTSLSDDEVAGLRCVRLIRPGPEALARLARLDLSRTVLVGAGAEDDPVSLLPPGTRFLVLGEGPSHEGPADLAGLAKFTALEWLDVGSRYSPATDLSPLAGSRSLRALWVTWRKPEHPEALSSLVGLRSLDLAGCETLNSLEFTRTLTALQRIRIGLTSAVDLSPLSDLPALEEVDATGSPRWSLGKDAPNPSIEKLPAGRWPSLRSLRILGTNVGLSEVAAFEKAHPACHVEGSAADALRAAITGVDRLRVRTGGTCHRHRWGEKTLFETHSPQEIAAFLALVRFERPEFSDRCQCCGSPTIEFYVGTNLAAQVGVHHGTRLRWPGGPWPGDAVLASDATDALARWFAARGAPGPLSDLDERRRSEAAAQHRGEREVALLPERLLNRFAGSVGRDEAVEAFRVEVPDPEARILLCLRLEGLPRGAGGGPVTISGATRSLRTLLSPDSGGEVAISRAAEAILGGLAPEAVIAAASKSLDDAEVCRGLARWWPREEAGARLADVGGGIALERAVGVLLEDPAPDVQEDGIALAARFRMPALSALLRRYVETRADPVLRLGDKADVWMHLAATRGVEALIETGDPEGARVLHESAARWPDTREEVEGGLRRAARQIVLLTASVRDGLAKTPHSPRSANEDEFAKAFPDPAARALVAFRLVAVGGKRYRGDAATDAAWSCLGFLTDDVLLAAARAAVADEEAVVGVGRLILDLPRGKTLDPVVSNELLARTGPALLAASSDVRVEAIRGISRIPGPTSIALLRSALPKLGDAPRAPEAMSEDAAAGLAAAVGGLLRLKDRESLPRLRAIVAVWDPESRAEFEEAVARMDEDDR